MNPCSFPGMPRAVQACAACVLITFASLASAQALPAVNSSATSYGSDAVGPVIPTTTTVPGEAVFQSATSFAYRPTPSGREPFHMVNGSSAAATDFGINRVGVTGELFGISEPGLFAFAYASGIADSRWNDRWTIGGGIAGDLLTVSLSGRTTYDLFLTGVSMPNPALQLGHGIYAGSPVGSDQVFFAADEFVTSAPAGYIDWVLSFNARSGDEVQVGMYLQAQLDGGSLGLNLGATDKRIAFDAMHTSLLESIEIPFGYSITAASGQLVAHDGGFAYRAVLAELANEGTVPEPHTLALAALGLFATGLASRRRRRK